MLRRLARFGRLLLLLLAAGLVVGLCGAALVPGFRTLGSAQHFEGRVTEALRPLDQRSVVRAANGEVVGLLGLQDRFTIPIEDVSQNMIHAVISTEDATFYSNPGLDGKALFRALRANVDSGEVTQGGSTITQQLVKMRILSPKRDFARKVREAVLAVRLTREYSKNEILEQYLNTVYFGAGSYGIGSAAERFFGVPASELDVAQAALLAGVIQNPSGYDPFSHPEAAVRRRAHVLRRMVDEKYITEAEGMVAAVAPVPTSVPPAELRPDNYFVAHVQDLLLDDPRLGATRAARYHAVMRGGLQVYTGYDLRAQLYATAAIQRTMPPDAAAKGVSASMIVMDPRTGEVKAVVNGAGYEQSKYDIVTARAGRQTGSTYKAVTLAAAIEAGYSPFDTVDGSSPCSVEFPGFPVYPLRNAEGSGGWQSLRSATTHSVNCAYVRLAASLGLDKVASMAERLGATIDRPAEAQTVEQQPSMTLGTLPNNLVEMATVYSTFAADGVRHRPVFIRKVVDSEGRVVIDDESHGERIVAPQVARTVTDLLQEVITRGTGDRARLDRPAAGKTGTTDDSRDALFAGYVPQAVAVVWMGRTADNQPMGPVGGFSRLYGGTYPAMIWRSFMSAYLDGTAVVDFTPPNEALWPGAARIAADGRGPSAPRHRRPSPSTTSTPPSTAPPEPRPPTTTGTSAPPPTTPTTPPTSAPPPPPPTGPPSP